MSCAKVAELVEMPFGFWTQVGPRKDVLGRVHTGKYHWTLCVRQRCGFFCQITL